MVVNQINNSIEQLIFIVRGHKVMFDADLAQLYGVSTKVLVQAVKRNLSRFPLDFMFQLTSEEFKLVTLNNNKVGHEINEEIQSTILLRSQIVTSKKGRGGRRYIPMAFTEQGVAMLSSVLNSEQAIQVNIEIMRTFVKLKLLLASNQELSQKITELERKYDGQFKIVFDAIRELMKPPEPKKRPIGFGKP